MNVHNRKSNNLMMRPTMGDDHNILVPSDESKCGSNVTHDCSITDIPTIRIEIQVYTLRYS